MASVADLSDKHQNLIADRGAQFFDAADKAKAWYRCRLVIKIAAASLLAHGFLLLVLILLELAPPRIERSSEIPVEVVSEPPTPEKKPAPATGAAEKSSVSQSDEPNKTGRTREVHEKPDIDANSKPSNSAASEPNHPENPTAPAANTKSETKPSAKPRGKDSPAAENPSKAGAAQEPRPSASAPSRDKTIQNSLAAQAGFTLPFDSGPEIFRAVAVPLPTEGGTEAMSYKVIVFGILARAKHYPETAIQRGAKGVAAIGFVLDDSGHVTSVSLLRSSGDADLDAESVALVSRAAPFPAPPPGAQRSFAAEVAFGMRN